jgi:hypothetical protein
MKLWLLVALAACGDSNANRCASGASQTCGCVGGGSGMQACGTDGTWGACTGCPLEPDASVPATCGPGIYPCGPYGYDIGATIADLSFVGQRDDNANGHIDTGDTATTLDLKALAAGVDVLVIDVCAEWCQPCQMDQPNLNALYGSYTAGGRVAFAGALTQDVLERPADLAALDRWGTQYHVPYPMLVDPDARTQLYLPEASYPEHLVIRTSNMTLVYRSNGPDSTLQSVIDGVVANP